MSLKYAIVALLVLGSQNALANGKAVARAARSGAELLEQLHANKLKLRDLNKIEAAVAGDELIKKIRKDLRDPNGLVNSLERRIDQAEAVDLFPGRKDILNEHRNQLAYLKTRLNDFEKYRNAVNDADWRANLVGTWDGLQALSRNIDDELDRVLLPLADRVARATQMDASGNALANQAKSTRMLKGMGLKGGASLGLVQEPLRTSRTGQ